MKLPSDHRKAILLEQLKEKEPSQAANLLSSCIMGLLLGFIVGHTWGVIVGSLLAVAAIFISIYTWRRYSSVVDALSCEVWKTREENLRLQCEIGEMRTAIKE